MKLLISILAGIVAGCLVFTAVVASPLLSNIYNSPQAPSEWLSNPLNVEVIVSNFTEPLGVGSEGIVTIVVVSTQNVSNVAGQFDLLQVVKELPIGIIYIEGNLANTTWTGNLVANVSMIFSARIKVLSVGYARIRVTATWWKDQYLSTWKDDSVWIVVQEGAIQISHEPINPPDIVVAHPGNGTLPTWPNGTIP